LQFALSHSIAVLKIANSMRTPVRISEDEPTDRARGQLPCQLAGSLVGELDVLVEQSAGTPACTGVGGIEGKLLEPVGQVGRVPLAGCQVREHTRSLAAWARARCSMRTDRSSVVARPQDGRHRLHVREVVGDDPDRVVVCPVE
jgi:hypothetical protein